MGKKKKTLWVKTTICFLTLVIHKTQPPGGQLGYPKEKSIISQR